VQTADRLAEALNRIVADPPPVAPALVPPSVQFKDAIEAAFRRATGA
jgi:hypothetical protein